MSGKNKLFYDCKFVMNRKIACFSNIFSTGSIPAVGKKKAVLKIEIASLYILKV